MRSHNEYTFGKTVKRIFLIIAITCLSITTVCLLCACDSDDINNLFQPSAFITFVLNNGDDDIIWQYGCAVPTPEKDGFEFLYWCTDIECENKAEIDFDEAPKTDMTLYAKWKELLDIKDVAFENTSVVYDGNKHSIAVNLPSGASIEYVGEHEFINAGTYTVNAIISKDGCKDLKKSATLTIEKAKIDKVEFEGETIVWDGGKHSIFVNTELPEEIKITYTGNGVSKAGEHLVVAHFDVGANYENIAEVSAILNIEPLMHTVTFDYGDRTETKKVEHGKSIENPPTLTARTGCIATWDKSLENVTSDMTVSIKYTLETYDIVYNYDCDKTGWTLTYNIETEVILPIVTRDCYVFDGWYTADGKKAEKIERGSVGDVVLNATWTPIEYKIIFHGENDEYINDTNNKDNSVFTVESETFILYGAVKRGYVFAGWYDNPECVGQPITAREKGTHGDLHLYAKWAEEV